MNRLIIDKNSTIKVHDRTIIVDSQKIPLSLIDILIISGDLEIDLKAISKIAKMNIPLLIVTAKPKEFIFIQKCSIKNGQLKEAQYKALEYKKEIATYILIEKAQRSHNFLQSFDLDRYIAQIVNARSVEELLGIEGSMAKAYFKLYFERFPKILTKGKRTKHPPLDPVNAMLSYIYTIFYYEIASRLITFGFEPTIGYLHKPFRDHMALASDLLELFRARIDAFVEHLFSDKILLPRDFTNKSGVYLTKTGRKKLWPHLKALLEENDPKIDQEIANLRFMIENVSSSDLQQK